jgi:hypothetical protein
MGCEVYANGDEIACKAGGNKVIAAFPDVCLSPPSPPAGPMPLPYPNTSFSRDMQNGSRTVMIKGKEVMLKDQSFYKTSPLGDEAATRGLGAGVVTHVITGKTYFVAWSMDVKFEDQNVDRHTDLTTSNHASQPGNTPKPDPSQGDEADTEITECPCCHGALHENQKDASGKALPTQTEEEYYQAQINYYEQRITVAAAWHKARPQFDNVIKIVSIAGNTRQVLFPDVAKTQKEMMQELIDEYKRLRAANPDCRNMHKPGDGCGTHFVVPREQRTTTARGTDVEITGTPAQLARRLTTPTVEAAVRRAAAAKYPGAAVTGDIAHMTPLDAGGCPVSTDNMIPKDTIEGADCKRIEDLQTSIQGGPQLK